MFNKKNSLVDLMFYGELQNIRLECVQDIMTMSKNFEFSIPDIDNQNELSWQEIESTLSTNEEVNLEFRVVEMNIFNKIVSNVFSNWVSLGEKVEILFFLDLSDIDSNSREKSISILYEWSLFFLKKYNLSRFECCLEGETDVIFDFSKKERGVPPQEPDDQ